jgi:hypothetical protein
LFGTLTRARLLLVGLDRGDDSSTIVSSLFDRASCKALVDRRVFSIVESNVDTDTDADTDIRIALNFIPNVGKSPRDQFYLRSDRQSQPGYPHSLLSNREQLWSDAAMTTIRILALALALAPSL